MNSAPTLEEARHALKNGNGTGIRVAVLDSGIDAKYASSRDIVLTDDLAVVEDEAGLRTVSGEGRDLFGHGTAVFDIVHHLAPKADIGSFRILGDRLRSRSLIIREGARQAIERGYHVLNCSFGCSRDDHVLLYKDWIDEAYLRDRHVVAACNNTNFMKREWPGHFPTVLTATFAQTRPDIFFYQKGQLVEFVALGQDVEVSWLGGERKRVTGSSFAAPHLTGLLVRLLSAFPWLSSLQAKLLMQQLAEPLPCRSSENQSFVTLERTQL